MVLDTNKSILADEKEFIRELKENIEKMLPRSQAEVPVQMPSHFTWPEVFRRIEETWYSVLR